MRDQADLNADMGESYGRWTLGDDAALMPYLSSANIACGFHGGDPHVMRRTVALALEHGVGIGAHVGLPDLMGFGRRRMAGRPEELEDYVVYQAGALQAFAGGGGRAAAAREASRRALHDDRRQRRVRARGRARRWRRSART